jgi:hypothetical protein
VEAPRPAQNADAKKPIDHSLLPAFVLRPVVLPPKPEKKPARTPKPESVD